VDILTIVWPRLNNSRFTTDRSSGLSYHAAEDAESRAARGAGSHPCPAEGSGTEIGEAPPSVARWPDFGATCSRVTMT
jgi:hypothetical protein